MKSPSLYFRYLPVVILLLIGMFSLNAYAENRRLSQPKEYVSAALECTLTEVHIQREDGRHEERLHCMEPSMDVNKDDKLLDLKGLPAGFENKYRSVLKQLENKRIGKGKSKVKLNISNIYRSDNTLFFNDNAIWNISEVTENTSLNRMPRLSSVTGQSTVLVLHITALDSQSYTTPAKLSDAVFGTYGDPVNLVSQFNACSYGKKKFVPASGANIVNGVASIKLNMNVKGTDGGQARDAATAEANRLFGKLEDRFDHVMFAMPVGLEGFIAYAYGTTWTVYSGEWAGSVSAQLHEIGHNLGLNHSGRGDSPYADTAGMMGYSDMSSDSPIKCFNAAKSSQLSWYTDKEISLTSSWTGRLLGAADYTKVSSGEAVLLKINGPNPNTLHITFNRGKSFNSGTDNFFKDKVTVIEVPNGKDAVSWSLATLGAGQSYTYPNFGGAGKDFTIHVNDFVYGTNKDYVNVQIAYNYLTPVTKYPLTVNSGTGGGSYTAGTRVTINANGASAGKVFDRWVVKSGSPSIASVTAANTTITMPNSAASVTATYKDAPLSLRNPESPTGIVNGLNYQYYHGSWSAVPNFASMTPLKAGSTSNFSLAARSRNDEFGFSFTGYINVPVDGTYTFYTGSDDGSKLYIGTQLVVNNDGIHPWQERSGQIGLKRGKHAIRVDFFDQYGFEFLDVSYQGPGISKRLIPSNALYRSTKNDISYNVAFQAEARTAQSGTGITSVHSGYTGSGFVDFGGNGSWIEWNNINVPVAGNYTLTFRYAVGSTTQRPTAVVVNGANIGSVPFTNTGSWTAWRTNQIKVSLKAGVNVIRLTASSGSGGPNLDRMGVILNN